MRFLRDQSAEAPKYHEEIEALLARATDRPSGTLHEHEVYRFFDLIGIETPAWHHHALSDPADGIAQHLPHAGPFVAKATIEGTTHKTDIGAIAFNVAPDTAANAVGHFRQKFSTHALTGVLFAEQLDHPPALGSELLLGLYQDPFFGPCVCLGLGGTRTEYYKTIMRPQMAQIYLPAAIDLDSEEGLLRAHPAIASIEGRVRGSTHLLAFEAVRTALKIFQRIGLYYSSRTPAAPFVIEELEINPAIAHGGRLVALDGVLRARKNDRAVSVPKPLEKIDRLLNPKTIAIAGASGKNPDNLSNIIVRKFLERNIPREDIFLLHPKETAIEGIPCTRDLSSLMEARKGEPVDCLIVGVPAKIAGPLVAEAFDRYAAHAVQIISAGFGETQAGKTIQQSLSQQLAHLDHTPERRPVVNGPNTLGNFSENVETLFTAQYKSSGTGRGRTNAALICQSGAFLITRISDLADVIAPRIGISVGNQMDLSVTDFFEHLLGKAGVDAFGLYIEGLIPGDGLRLMRLIGEARAKGIFTIIYKAGRTAAGMAAAQGHTAAMAGDYAMFAHLMRRAGALVADTFQEFGDLMMLASYSDPLRTLRAAPRGKKLGVAMLSNAGFEKCAMADHLLANHPDTFDLARYTPHTHKRLAAIFADRGAAGIVDLQDILDLSPMMNDAGYDAIIRATLEDEGVDIGIFSIVPETVTLNTCESSERHREDFLREGSIFDRLVRIRREITKPFIISFESGPQYARLRKELLAAGIPCFSSVDAAVRAVANVLETAPR